MNRITISLILIASVISMNALSQNARVQVIHNSADAAAASVDVYLNNALLIDDFAFRTASPFIDAPAGVQITVGIAPSNSTSSADAIATFDYTLAAGETYVLVAEGIVSPSGYSPATPFGIAVYAMGRESASMMSNTDVLVHHGCTDAPTVDVVEIGAGAGTIVDNASYGDFAGYLELPTADYTLDIRDETGTVSVATYNAPLSTLNLDGNALVVVASGFLNPSNNSNGPAFGLFAALPSGGALVQLPATTTSIIDSEFTDFEIFPNPTVDYLKIDLTDISANEINILDSKGAVVLTVKEPKSELIEINVSNLPMGNYKLVVVSSVKGLFTTNFIKK